MGTPKKATTQFTEEGLSYCLYFQTFLRLKQEERKAACAQAQNGAGCQGDSKSGSTTNQTITKYALVVNLFLVVLVVDHDRVPRPK